MMHQYKLLPRWWRCVDPECAVMWDSPVEVICWVCDGLAVRAQQPYVTSQTGAMPAPTPVLDAGPH